MWSDINDLGCVKT